MTDRWLLRGQPPVIHRKPLSVDCDWLTTWLSTTFTAPSATNGRSLPDDSPAVSLRSFYDENHHHSELELIGLYGALLIFSFFNMSRSGNDAAGRGMESGFIFIGIVLLAALVGLNLMHQRAARITALVLAGLPLLFVLFNLISNYWVSYQQQKRDAEQATNSRSVRDSSR